jgi:integrase
VLKVSIGTLLAQWRSKWPQSAKRGDRYHVQIRKKGQPTLTKSFAKKADAQTWAKTVESRIERGVFLDTSQAQQQTIADVLERYRAEILPKLSCTALRSDPFRLNTLVEYLGKVSLAKLSSAQVSTFRDERLLQVGPASVVKELGLLSRVLNTATKEWGIYLPHGNPVSQVRMPRRPKGRERRISSEEETSILQALQDNPVMRSLVVFAIETGMRRGEIAGMCRDHINWKAQTLQIPETKTDVPRTIPLSRKAVEVLRELPRRLDGNVWGLRPDSITQAFERACKRAGIEDLRFHDLRHEATSRFFEKGLNTMEVSSITGHQDLRMLKRYTHIRAESLVSRL